MFMMDVKAHVRQGVSAASIPTAIQRGRKGKDKGSYIQEKSHLSGSDKHALCFV